MARDHRKGGGLSEQEWRVTAYGLECGDFLVETDRCIKVSKGRYPVIKEICSRFISEVNELGFLRAWRESLEWQRNPIDEDAFNLTMKEVARMKAHRFIYRAVQDFMSPRSDQGVPAYFQRRHHPDNQAIEDRATAIFRTATPDRKGAEAYIRANQIEKEN